MKTVGEATELTMSHKGTYKYDAIKRCQPLVWGNMTHDDASVETGVGGQAKYDTMMVFCSLIVGKCSWFSQIQQKNVQIL